MEEGWLEMLSFENTQEAAALQGVGVCVAGKTRVKKKKGAKIRSGRPGDKWVTPLPSKTVEVTNW